MSRKLLFAAGMAFCFDCQLRPPAPKQPATVPLFPELEVIDQNSSLPFIASGMRFAETAPLEFLATFVDKFVTNADKRKNLSEKIFGSYNAWLELLADDIARRKLETLEQDNAGACPVFQKVRKIGSEFASGLKLLFFNREEDTDPIADLCLEYVAF